LPGPGAVRRAVRPARAAIHRDLTRRTGAQAADDLLAATFLTAFGKRRGYDRRYPDARPWL